MKVFIRIFLLLFVVAISPLTASHALDWPVVSFAAISNKNPVVGEVVEWKVTVDCRGSALSDIDLMYTDPTGRFQSVFLGNRVLKNPRPQDGTFNLSLKITNQAISGLYKVTGVGVWCVGDPNYPGRYARGALQGNLRYLDFAVNNPNSVACIPPKLESIRLVSDSSVSAGDRIIIEAVVKLSGVINHNLLIVKGPSEFPSDQDYDQEEWTVLPSADLQKPGDLILRWVFLVTNKWEKGTYKIAHLSFGGLEGFKRDRVDLNSYPFFSTDRECGVRYSARNGDQLNPEFASIEPKLVQSLSFNVVELSPTAKKRILEDEKRKLEAPAKNLVLAQLKIESVIGAIVKKHGKTGDSLHISSRCIDDPDSIDDGRGATVEIQEQALKGWIKTGIEAKWALRTKGLHCQGQAGRDYGSIWSLIAGSDAKVYRVRLSWLLDQEFFDTMAKASVSSHSREIFDAVALNALDLVDLETTLYSQRNEELRIQNELKAKQEAEAKAAAELKATQEAEAKAVAEKLAAEKIAAAKTASAKKTTITCIKGKLTKKVTAVKPKCPVGYKKK